MKEQEIHEKPVGEFGEPNELGELGELTISETDALTVELLFTNRLSETLLFDKDAANIQAIYAASRALLATSNILTIPGIALANTPIPKILSDLSLNFAMALNKINLNLEQDIEGIKSEKDIINFEEIQNILNILSNVNVELPDDLK